MNEQTHKLPWLRNVFVLIGFALSVAFITLFSEVFLLLRGFEQGLPEVLTTPLFSICLLYTSPSPRDS